MFHFPMKAAAAILAVCLAAQPAHAAGLLNGSKDLAGHSASALKSVKTSASAPTVKFKGIFGEKYAVSEGVPVVLPPDGSEIPQPTITKNKSGNHTVSYSIDRKKQYSANDQSVIKIIDSWNTVGKEENFDVKTLSGAQKVTGVFDMAAAKKIFMSVNEKRIAAGLSPLSWDAALANAAKLRAAEITISNSHTRPDGTPCFTAVKGMTGENIAYGYPTPEVAMSEWMSSPGHKANILRGTFSQLGVAAFKSGGETYWVQDFAGY